MRHFTTGRRALAGLLLVALAAAGCDGFGTRQEPIEMPHTKETVGSQESIFGPDGLSLLGGSRQAAPATGIGVNSYLWRASLDTIAFMPLLSADPFGGVIITDWYAPPETPDERFKMTVYILDRTLRADAVQVSVFRQEQAGDDGWQDRPTSRETAVSLENKILDRARQLRTGSLGG
jgi:hypothetical protein